jgi:hypothetical protein
MAFIQEGLPREPIVGRLAGTLFGIVTHLIFFVTAWCLFWFLIATPGIPSDQSVLIDLGLIFQFAISHSLWLWPPLKKRLGRLISRSFYGCFYCLMTCLSLGLVMWQWRTIPGVIWQTSGTMYVAIWCGYIASWVFLLYSVSLTGAGFQTGFTEWQHWIRRLPLAPRTFIQSMWAS